MANWCVVGGGFKGIISAALLANAKEKVVLIESGKQLGGVMCGIPYQNFWLDIGCHVFDNTDPEITKLLFEILGQSVLPVNVKYAGFIESGRYDGYSVPNLEKTSLDFKGCLWQIFEQLKDKRKPKNLKDYLELRFGTIAAEKLVSAAEKKICMNPETLDIAAKDIILFDRIAIFEKQLSIELKKHPELNNRIALSSENKPAEFYPDALSEYPYRNFYPKGKGMQTFAERAKLYLEKLGVEILLNSNIQSVHKDKLLIDDAPVSFDHLVWSSELAHAEKYFLGTNQIEDLLQPMPLVVYYFFPKATQCSDYTYVHDHRKNSLTFRSSNAGIVGQQIIDEKTYITCEIPCKINSQIWEDTENFSSQIWSEAVEHGIVSGNEPTSFFIKKSDAIKLPKVGFTEIEERIKQQITEQGDNIHIFSDMKFARQEIVSSIQSKLKEIIV